MQSWSTLKDRVSDKATKRKEKQGNVCPPTLMLGGGMKTPLRMGAPGLWSLCFLSLHNRCDPKEPQAGASCQAV